MSILFVSNEQPTIVGGMLLVKKGALLAKPPIFEWIGEEKSGSQKGSTQRAARSKGRLGRRYRIVDGVTIRGKVEYIADDYTFYSLHQGHHRKVYAIPRRVSAGSADSVSCNVTDRVGKLTRREASRLSLRGTKGVNTRFDAEYYKAIPEWVSIQRVQGASNFALSGGRRVRNDLVGATLEAYELDLGHPILRASWTDDTSATRRDLYLFLLAAVSGLGVAALLEGARPAVDRLGTGRS